MTTCNWQNNWTDSGDRGMAQADHDRECHPDHAHVFADSPYEWEQAGQPHIANGERTNVTPRPVTVQRCVHCTITPDRVRVCR